MTFLVTKTCLKQEWGRLFYDSLFGLYKKHDEIAV